MERPFARKSFKGKKDRFDHRSKFANKEKKWQLEEKEIEELKVLYEEVESSQLKEFSDFPLSFKTKQGLQHAKYVEPTDIQRESIPLALRGHDILGAAKTGSGKTLAFLIPMIELLFRQKWTTLDGLGALVITPTRELAYQIFEVLRKIGRSHDFSAGLVIGGKNLKDEAQSISRTNIVICTPGRLLQHMDETVHFHADNLQMLVLDEADRILDLGFQQSMNAIIENLPHTRQTLLFSATQTKSVKDLARLSLKEPMYVSVHENSQHSTPTKLEQSYLVCELHEKMDVLWSFIKNHLKTKILIFMSSCKQVRYIYEIFRKLRPGTNVMALHGAMPQLKRMAMYDGFVRKQNAVLFATDIAARGLDFPAVNWVVQLDCPEDANTYIHRAGRTARYETDGEALLVLLPSEEEAMVKQLTEKKIPINKIRVNPKKLWSVQGKIESLCASDIQLKEYAQRTFVSYLKSVFLMSNKQVFNVSSLDTDQYARSLGLAISPRVRFIKKEEKRLEQKRKLSAAKKQSKKVEKTSLDKGNKSDSAVGSSSSEEEEEASDSGGTDSSGLENEEAGLSHTRQGTFKFEPEDESDDDILTVKKGPKREIPGVSSSDEDEEDEDDDQHEKETELSDKTQTKKDKTLSKAALAKKLHKKKIVVNKKVVFDEEGEAIQDIHKKSNVVEDNDEEMGGINIEQAKQRMVEEDKIDKQLYREKIKQRHREQRLKKKEENRKKHRPVEEEGEEVVAVLGNSGDEDSEGEIERLEATLGNSDNEEDVEQYSEDDKDERGWAKDQSMDSSDEEDDSNEYESEETDDDDSEEEEEEEEEDDSPPLKKIRKNAVGFDTGLCLEDDEAIALKLLQNS